jgi:predicted transposase/invertase (TIGR01784 family)
MLSKFLDPKNDLAFKRIFGSEKNKEILIHFLNDIFDLKAHPIKEVSFLKTNHDPSIASQRSSLVDILCQDSVGHHFIVEMQVAHEPGFEKRAQYYAAKTYIQQREKGIDYKDLKQVTFLAITDFALFPENKKYLSHHHILDTETHERHLKDFSFSFLELPKFKKPKNALKSMTDKWAYFFKYANSTKEEDLEDIVGTDFIIRRAYEELNRYAWSSEELRTYESIDMKQSADRAILEGKYNEGIEIGMEKGIEIGMEKGVEIGVEKGIGIGQLNVAKSMLSEGVAFNTIAKWTGLSIDEIIKLQK